MSRAARPNDLVLPPKGNEAADSPKTPHTGGLTGVIRSSKRLAQQADPGFDQGDKVIKPMFEVGQDAPRKS